MFPELVFGAIKKSGKTTLAAIIMLTMLLLFGGRFAEGFCVANDLEQAQSRVFAIIKRIIEASPLLKRPRLGSLKCAAASARMLTRA